MSGAEALAGVSLVCNIIQIVTFVRDVVITYKSIEDGHSPDPRLAQLCEAVKIPYEGLLQDTQGHVGPMGKEEQALVQGAQKCVERTEELSRMVSRLSVPANSSRPRKTMMVIGRSVSSLWRKKEVAALEKDLERYQALVDTHLLRHISGNVRSSETQNLRSFAELDDRLKHLLSSYQTDNATIHGFISEQIEKTQACIKQTGTHITAHVDRQLAVTEHVIRSDITALETSRLDEKTRAEQEERRKRVLESLYFPERNSRWNRIQENYPETFEWVFSIPKEPKSQVDDDDSDDSYSQDGESEDSSSQEDESGDDREAYGSDEDKGGAARKGIAAPAFAPWLQSDSKQFWISGKPASGKSTLMKYIITNPKTSEYLQEWKSNVHIIHHFFWKPGVSMENSVDGMLCSLVYQILDSQPSFIESISGGWLDLEAKRSHHDWSTKELRDTFFRLLKEAEASFCIFLDGLDEAVEQLHEFKIKSLLDGLMQMDGVKICASGRPEPKFAKYFTETEQLAIHDLTSKDIQRLANSRLEGMDLDPRFRWDLARIVVARAQGVFMWVILVLNSVEMNIERETPEECLQRVSRMAQDLHSLYKDMWTRATYYGIDRGTATLYFNLVVKRHFFTVIVDLGSMTVFELAMMADENFMTTFFEDYDSVTTTELFDLIEKTKKRVELGTAGLLECVTERDPNPGNADVAALEKIGVCADYVVNFTHRSVFDFFTDSEDGRNILLESSLANREYFAMYLKSVMLGFRYLRNRGDEIMSSHRNSFLTFVSPCAQMAKFVGWYEAYDPGISGTADEMVKPLWEWQLRGYFDSHLREQEYRLRFSLPVEPTSVRLVEFVEALMEYHPRMAIEFIQKLGAADLSIALPVILRTIEDLLEWLHIVRRTLSRLSELVDTGMYGSQEDLSRDVSLALSFFLRKLFFILHIYGSYGSQPETSKHVQHIRKSAADTMEWFTKLDVSGHCWSRSFVISLHVDVLGDCIYWEHERCFHSPKVMVACNDLFLKRFLAPQEGFRGLQGLGHNATSEPTFDVLLFYVSLAVENQPWIKPSVSWARKMEHLLSQTLTGKQSFISVKDQYEELFKQVKGTQCSMEPGEYDQWKRQTLAQLEDRQHPWIPIHLS